MLMTGRYAFRTGVVSNGHGAAATPEKDGCVAQLMKQAGYATCYNVLEGFEGDRDASGRRNTTGGWRAAGLPWTQS